MTKALKAFQRLFENPWFVALILLGVFFIVTDYKYSWDDQNLEIPLLKHLIDPALYQGDYYVESLKKNFATYFYPILARVITVDQIPATYFLLYIISRYFMIFWIYKLWLHISADRFKAFSCVLVFIYMTRVQEFLYRTFSHQEFALGIIFAGIYFFFKERFILSSILLGIAANFHALYSLFPMLFMQTYLVWQIKKHGFKTLFKTCVLFTIFALPFILWILDNRLLVNPATRSMADNNWLSLFILACPQNFFYPEFPLIPFKRLVGDWSIFMHFNDRYIILIIFFFVNIFLNPHFRTNKKTIAFSLGASGLMVLAFIFTYLHPSRFFIDLNLVRNSQFMLFLLMGYTTILVFETIEKERALVGFAMAILFTFLKYGESVGILSLITMALVLLLIRGLKEKSTWLSRSYLGLGIIGIPLCIWGIVRYFNSVEFSFPLRLNLTIIFLLLTLTYFAHYWFREEKHKRLLNKIFLLIPLTIFLYQYSFYHYQQVKTEKEGLTPFWKLQGGWEDMQRYVKGNTPKDSMILIPYNMEMGGFRILSERKVVVCYRDCGIIGFDYAAAQEWRQRINDIKPYKVVIQGSISEAIKTAIAKYKANYIVFMRYAAPRKDSDILERMYTNSDFALFKVNLPQSFFHESGEGG